MNVTLIVHLDADHPFPPAMAIKDALEERWPGVWVQVDTTDPEVAECVKRTRELLAPA